MTHTTSEEQTFLADLDKKLWNAADRLRSNLDAAVYKHAVLGLIFLKYVSDAFDLRREELETAFRDPKSDYYIDRTDYRSDAAYDKVIHVELEDRDYFTEKNVFWVPPLARWRTIRENAALAPDTEITIRNGKTEKYVFRSVARLIDDALEAVEKENPRLKGVIEKNRYMQLQLEPAKLVGLISEVVSSIPFRHASLNAKDILGHVYEYFLGQFALPDSNGFVVKPLKTSAASLENDVVAETAFGLFSEAHKKEKSVFSITSDRLLLEAISASAVQRISAYRGSATSLSVGSMTDAIELAVRMENYFEGEDFEVLVVQPRFKGSGILSACYGDLLCDDCLYEIKMVDRNLRSIDLRQVLTYCALNSQSHQRIINSVGILNPRRGISFRFNLDELAQYASRKNAAELCHEIIDFLGSFEAIHRAS